MAPYGSAVVSNIAALVGIGRVLYCMCKSMYMFVGNNVCTYVCPYINTVSTTWSCRNGGAQGGRGGRGQAAEAGWGPSGPDRGQEGLSRSKAGEQRDEAEGEGVGEKAE